MSTNSSEISPHELSGPPRTQAAPVPDAVQVTNTQTRVITIEVENYVRAIHEDLSVVISNTDAMRGDVNEIRQIIEDQQLNTLNQAKVLEMNELKEWLTQCDPKSTYVQYLNKISVGSGKWFLEDAFDKWADNASGDRALWLRGYSGAGKTTLISAAIRYLRTIKQWDVRPLSAYFYCSFAMKETQTPSNVLGSFIFQLLDQIEGFSAIVKEARASARRQEPAKSNEANVEDLETLLSKGCTLTQKDILLFLDAPNESEEAEDIVHILARVTTKNANLRLMIASTPDLDFCRLFATPAHVMPIGMDFRKVNRDILVYVDMRIRQEKRLRKLPAAVQDKVRMTFAENTRGSFRWAECQLAALIENARSVAHVERALQSISPTLEELYIAALDAIPPLDRPLLKGALHWLMFATRSLRIEEISEAMIFRGGGSSIEPADRLFLEGAEEILRRCPMLIQYDATYKRAALAHSSVQQFLFSEECRLSTVGEFYFNRAEDLCALTRLMVDYLNQPAFRSGYCLTQDELEMRLDGWPLLRYTSYTWQKYTKVMAWPSSTARKQMEDALQRLFTTFSLPGGGNFGSWVQIHLPRHLHYNKCLSHPLYYAARAGSDELVNMIVLVEGKGVLELQGGSRHSTPLHVASAYGHTKTVRLLLDHGANPNERNWDGERGIEWAAIHGYQEIVDLLLQHGADPLEDKFEEGFGDAKFDVIESFIPRDVYTT